MIVGIEVGSEAGVEGSVLLARAPTKLVPQIVFPSLRRAGSALVSHWVPCDSTSFPDQLVIKERHDRGEGRTHLPMFGAHVRGALDRVLVVDTYLLCAGEAAEDAVISWFPDGFAADKVRIACGGLGKGRDEQRFRTRLSDRAKAINLAKTGTGLQFTKLELKLTLDPTAPPYVHDRFAVIDDELWHFGATVGGLHHTSTAATRGWDAEATDAERFFNEVWTQRRSARTGSRSACERRT